MAPDAVTMNEQGFRLTSFSIEYELVVMAESVQAWTDKSFPYVNVPTEMQGAYLIRFTHKSTPIGTTFAFDYSASKSRIP